MCSPRALVSLTVTVEFQDIEIDVASDDAKSLHALKNDPDKVLELVLRHWDLQDDSEVKDIVVFHVERAT